MDFYKIVKPSAWIKFYMDQHAMNGYEFASLCDLSHCSIYNYLSDKPICSVAAYKIQKGTSHKLLYEFLTDKPKTKKVQKLESVNGSRVYTIVLPGPPIPELRHRVSFKQRRVYSSQTDIKVLTRQAIASQFDHAPLLGSVSLHCYFFMPIPLSASLKKKREAVEGLQLHIKKPDGDNLRKFVQDQMNGIVYKDDAQVQGSEHKIESTIGYTIMIIKPLELYTKKK